MNKREFLLELERYLRSLSTVEKNDILQDYEEHFTFGIEEGKSEEEISAALGSPKQLAREILADYHIEKMETSKSTGNVFRAVWSVIGLGFINLILVLGPFLTVVSLIFAGWILGISFTLSPILVLLNALFNIGTFEWFDLFFSLTLSGLGIFLSMGMYYVSLGFINLLLRYLKYNISIVKGGK
ncbi:HAAS signaling domain-containing protein [Lederbergia galactosidilytica]|uniref:DUF1700 domain-containing protein n=1 Tax=Lederbergia galactosidilytica TaxID=217031 RepID=A0A0Q9Y7W8_9BACI|nr:DUF1700 domain-containing protein [Lederbergia galactosidilytica]KRG14904.1 hypothetical protein ACA30_09565 [Virgibacillus soli]KRG16908.1 hypothetical protein ACA29_02210 [Lederbergia galactosidilytica]MBP1917347.1 putative membrane protein [Lederbergia galactosidilytica]OAK69153.1 hypothetical protein ABB05_14430 [Lederbergia galactosidilytica]